MGQFPILETERLDLIKLNHQYDQAYFDLISQEQVAECVGSEVPENKEEAVNIIESFQTTFEQNKGLQWGIILKKSKNFIGTIGLKNVDAKDKKAVIGFEIHPVNWRHGYPLEALQSILQYAFKELDLFRIGVIILQENTNAGSLLDKVGFTLEGKLRGYVYQGNQSRDAFVYSMLQSEWTFPAKETAEIEERLQYSDHMSEIIKKAERDGHFDDLPGKGKPLNLGQDYMNPAEKQLYKTMKDNHILPRWIELGNEIDILKQGLDTLEKREKQKRIKEINKKVKEYNMGCPPSLQRNRVGG
jgi:RimJ/RimL family protein N-acetyltransferase